MVLLPMTNIVNWHGKNRRGWYPLGPLKFVGSRQSQIDHLSSLERKRARRATRKLMHAIRLQHERSLIATSCNQATTTATAATSTATATTATATTATATTATATKPQSREAPTTNVLVRPGTILDGNQTSVAEALTTKWLGKALTKWLTPQIFGLIRGPKVFVLQFFREYDGWNDTYMMSYNTQHHLGYNTYKQHNIALKYVRDDLEARGCSYVLFSNDIPILVPQFVRDRGPDYHFVGKPIFPWKWQEMVAQMDDRSQEVVVHAGQTNAACRSRGIVSCSLQQLDIVDHKRSYVAQGERRFRNVWYFVLECEDGTCVFLHPSINVPKIECGSGHLPASDIVPTSGAGTFSRFMDEGELRGPGRRSTFEQALRFDHTQKHNHRHPAVVGIASSSS